MQILAPVWATVFSGMFWISAVRPFASEIAGAMGTSVSMVGQVSTLSMLAMAIGGLFAGPVADHIGRRRCIVAGLSLMAIAAGLLGVSAHVAMLLGAGLIGGVGVSMTYGVALGVVVAHFDGDQRRKAIGLTTGFGSAATILSAPLLTLIATLAAWRGSFLVLGLSIAVAAVMVMRLLPKDGPIPAERVSPVVILRAYRPLWKRRSAMLLFLAAASRGVLSVGVGVYIAAYYVDHYGMSLRMVGLVSSIEGLGLVAGGVIGGTLVVKLPQRPLFAAGIMATGIGWWSVYTLNPPVMIAVALVVLTAMLIGMTMTVLAGTLAEESPCRPATTMALKISAIGFGAAFGAGYGGIVIETGGYTLLGFAALPFAILSALLVWRPAVPTVTFRRRQPEHEHQAT